MNSLFLLTKSVSSSSEATPPLDQSSCFFPTPNVTSPGENQHPVQMEMDKYPQDSSALDELLINQLLEIPELLNALSDPNLPCNLGLDTNATFASMDVNYNTNFGPYPQDFSQFNDIQFNMLVNENQHPQAEPQDGVLQMKTEDEL